MRLNFDFYLETIIHALAFLIMFLWWKENEL